MSSRQTRGQDQKAALHEPGSDQRSRGDASTWRNGGGQTRELWTWPSAEGWRVRVSVAGIEKDGPLRGHDDWVRSATFSPDGSFILTVSSDGTARVWSADGTGQPVVLRGHDDSIMSAAFSPDGSRIVTASDDFTARVWSMNAKSLASAACAYAGRNFTRREWLQFFPDTDYHKTCEQWPEALPETR